MSRATSPRRRFSAIGVGPHPHHRLADGDAELDHHHALGLVQLDAVPERASARPSAVPPSGWLLRVEQGLHGDVGEGQRVGRALAGDSAPGSVAVDVQHTQPGGADLQREREHRPDAVALGGRRVPRPAGRPRLGEVGDQDRAAGVERVEARPLAEDELQLLDLGATYLDENGREQHVWMGSYGIGPARIVAAAVEQFSDEHGISWPRSLAPWDVEIVALGKPGSDEMAAAEALHEELRAVGLRSLLDDRDAGTGEKFADAELLGCRCGSRWGGIARRGYGRGQVRRGMTDIEGGVPLTGGAEAVRTLWADTP